MFKNRDEVYDKIVEFIDESYSLAMDFSKELYNEDINDWAKIRSIHEILEWGIWHRLISYDFFEDLVYDIENEKDRFKVQKRVKQYEKDTKTCMDRAIKCIEIIGFRDDRCIDFQKRLTEFMCNVKVFFWDEE